MMFFRIAEPTSLRGLPLCFVVLLAVVTQSLGQSLVSDKPQSETVRGTVINAVTQTPIPRALVISADNRAGVLTDGEGRFEITLPLAESGSVSGGMVFDTSGQPWPYARHGNGYWFMARKPGFLDDPNARAHVATSSGDDLTIALMPEAIIKGRITVASGDPALGITVQLFSRQVRDGLPRWTSSSTARANSAGEFRFAELQPGSYKLVTQEYMDNDPITNIPGSQQYAFPPVYYPGVSDFSAASTVELNAGQEFQADVSLARQPYYAIKVPIAGAEISGRLNVSVQGQRGPGYSLGYNAAQRAIVGLLPNGTYLVEASTFGKDSVSGSVGIRVTGAAVDGPAITLAPKSSVRLDVREEFTDTSTGFGSSGSWSDGKHTFSFHGPRAYLQASVESADDLAQPQNGSIRPPTGSNDDSLVIEDLSPGRYWLRLHTARGYIASATQGSTDLLRQPLTIGSGPAAPIEVRVRDDVAELDGTITTLAQPSAPGEESAERPPVWVYFVPLPGSSGEFTEFTSSGGEFSQLRMTPGDYRMLAFSAAQPRLPYRDAEAMKAYDSKGPVVHLAASQKTTVRVETILSE